MKLFKKFYEDIFIVLGVAFIAVATFLISPIAGLYVIGAAFLGVGVWFTKHPIG